LNRTNTECSHCQGNGRIIIGEHFVTREMALAAGIPELEGTHFDFEYGKCFECSGSGVSLTLTGNVRIYEILKGMGYDL